MDTVSGIRIERIRIGGIRIGGIRVVEWICVGYVWCEIRQQSSEEPCDETSFGKNQPTHFEPLQPQQTTTKFFTRLYMSPSVLATKRTFDQGVWRSVGTVVTKAGGIMCRHDRNHPEKPGEQKMGHDRTTKKIFQLQGAV